MRLDRQRCRQPLRDFELRHLFVEELGWDRHAQTLQVPLDGQTYTLSAIAEKHGMVAFECPAHDSQIPDSATRRKIQTRVAKSVHEHLIVYLDEASTEQVWQWVKREPGRPRQCREHRYHHTQPGDSLLEKLELIAFTLEEEADLTLVDVTGRVRAAFDVDRVTRRFYDRFRSEHADFSKFLKGIPDEDMQRWYVSVMLNRLMFIYFIQKKGFLDGDPDYLRTKLADSKGRGRNRFYREFLCPLFFDGFAKREGDRSAETKQLLGGVPYLNGGIFMRHQIEELHGEAIQIADAAFDKLFAFFDAYQWHLDERPLRRDDEINPDVLGYIFEKYINQKQMGAYYTKEDITGYISQNTVIPHLLDAARGKCRVAFEGEQSVWNLLQDDPDRYLYPAVRSGVIDEHGEVIPESALPDFVQVGMHDPKARMFDRRYNLGEASISGPNGANLALPTETWREYVERRKRCLELRDKLRAGEVSDINDLITYNLDIRQFAQDVVENCEGPELLRALWQAIQSVSVLDPACGSGAFLFAALNILEPLYEACLERMEGFLGDLERSGERRHPRRFADFRETLERVEKHPNRRYFILKSIVLNNLFGVDIMEEAVEICKLRLFLKLVAQLEPTDRIEPLPDIDFNIQAGNTLVGYAKLEDIRCGQGRLDFEDSLGRIEQKALELDEQFSLFRQQQTELGGEVTAADKAALRARLRPLEDELNRYLSSEYGVDVKKKDAYAKWLASHKPFHWFIEFYGIMKSGGFDVIIGNPPYVEYARIRGEYTIRGYGTEQCGNLYAFATERSMALLKVIGSFGFIVPMSLVCTQRMAPAQRALGGNARDVWLSNYAERPSKLFTGSEVLLTIALARPAVGEAGGQHSTGLTKWSAEERETLFECIHYQPVSVHPKPHVIPKASAPLDSSMTGKMLGTNGSLGYALRPQSKHRAYYRIGGGRYWKVFTNFQPRFVLNGKSAVSSRENYLYLERADLREAAIAVLSSSLFYWWFILTTNGRDLNPSDLREFPLNLADVGMGDLGDLAESCAKLMHDYRAKSEMKHKVSSLTGEITYQEFYPRLSKPIIDEIDCILAKHYGFTDEELDFIINYDIKYRMGRDAEEIDQGVIS